MPYKNNMLLSKRYRPLKLLRSVKRNCNMRFKLLRLSRLTGNR